jgi:predicted DNA binding CopG/RHH family protein
MKNEYDFSNAKKNPYASKLKKQVTIRIDESAIDYFKNLAKDTGISYQNLVNLYLVDCAKNKRKLEISFS